jgi:hypothetical protein
MKILSSAGYDKHCREVFHMYTQKSTLQVGLTDCILLHQIDLKSSKELINMYDNHTIYFFLKTPKLKFEEIQKSEYKMIGLDEEIQSTLIVSSVYTCSLLKGGRLLEISNDLQSKKYQLSVFDIMLDKYGNSAGYSIIRDGERIYSFPDEVRLPFIFSFEIIYIGKSEKTYNRLNKHEKYAEFETDRILNEESWENTDLHVLLYNYRNNSGNSILNEHFNVSELYMPNEEVPESILIDYFKPKFNNEFKTFNKDNKIYDEVKSHGFEYIFTYLDCTAQIETRTGNTYSLVLPLRTEMQNTLIESSDRPHGSISIVTQF